jgi:hypothetical protein
MQENVERQQRLKGGYGNVSEIDTISFLTYQTVIHYARDQDVSGQND